MRRIGILGGTFDPIHLGHLIPAEYAVNHLGLERVLLVPSASPVHRPKHVPASGEDRLAMCRLAAAPIPSFGVSDAEVARPEPSYTVLTLRHFAEVLGRGVEIVLLVGEDNLPLLHTWRDLREILLLARVAVLPREVRSPLDLSQLRGRIGDEATERILGRRVPAPIVPISATEIRRRIAAGEPIAGLVPESVERYIVQQGLYQGAAKAEGRGLG